MGEWDNYSVAFGQRIKTYRMENDYTQEQLGKLLYITPTTLSRVENGRKEPSSNIIHYIAKNTTCDIDWLLLGVKSETFYMDDILEQLEETHGTGSRSVMYVIEMIKLKLLTQDNSELENKKYYQYRFNLHLAERVCEEYDNNADEGQVFKSIRLILGKTIKEMGDILGVKSTRYGYLEKYGRPTSTELIKLYDRLKVNPGFVLRGQCQEMTAINELLKGIKEGVLQ